MRCTGMKKQNINRGTIEYAAGNVKRTFLLGFLFAIWFYVGKGIITLVSSEVLLIVLCVEELLLCVVSTVLLVEFLCQLFFTALSFFFGKGWHEGRLTDKQLKRSVYGEGVKEQSYYGCTYVYWKGLFMKRYLEGVK